MSRGVKLAIAFGTGLLLTCAYSGRGDDSSSKRATAKKYGDLVQTLVSPNTVPTTRNGSGGAVEFPSGYDVKAQKRIEAARQTLHDNFEEALPFLVDALEDDQYCMTINWASGDAYYNYSVGQVCRDVIASRLEVYRDKIRFTKEQWQRFNYGPITKEWCNARQGRSLVELQIEAIDWSIERLKAESKVKNAPNREEKAREITALQKFRHEILESGTPVKGSRMLPMVVTNRP